MTDSSSSGLGYTCTIGVDALLRVPHRRKFYMLSYSEVRLVPKKRTERLAEDAEGRQREFGTGSDKERGSA